MVRVARHRLLVIAMSLVAGCAGSSVATAPSAPLPDSADAGCVNCGVASRTPEDTRALGAAVVCAERFVREQGYANTPPVGPVRHELVDFGSDGETAASRRNSLFPDAVSACPGRKASRVPPIAWQVQFAMRIRDGGSVKAYKDRARAVLVSPDCQEIEMAHKPTRLFVAFDPATGCGPVGNGSP
jgi:hypothetical protein